MEKKVRINKKNKEVRIALNKKFYTSTAISEAINDFKKICFIKINNNIITLKPKSPDINLAILGYEFCNYLLALTKDRYLI